MAIAEFTRRMKHIMNSMRFAFGLVFLVSGLSHIHTATVDPEVYREFSETALVPIYTDLIDSTSTSMMPIMISLVGLYEMALGVVMVSRGFLVKIGLVMGIVFAVAVSLLGPEELPALVMVPLFGYLLTKQFDQSLLGTIRLRLGIKEETRMPLAQGSSDMT